MKGGRDLALLIVCVLLHINVMMAADNAGSCVGYCGVKNKKSKCFCDIKCTGHGDCCSDFEEACPDLQSDKGESCEGYCGKKSVFGCWCDEKCSAQGDCCGDYEDVCPSSSSAGAGSSSSSSNSNNAEYTDKLGSCAGRCGSHALTAGDGKCWCDSQCTGKGDCCEDYVAECKVGEGSCLDKCGTSSTGSTVEEPNQCWCDHSCSKKGDCCADYAEHCGSGSNGGGGGGGVSPSEEDLKESMVGLQQCLRGCACLLDPEYCCGDKWDNICQQTSEGPQCAAECASAPKSEMSESSCVGVCGKKNTEHKCWCDAKCASKGDCCADYSEVCAPADDGGAEEAIACIQSGKCDRVPCAVDKCKGPPPTGTEYCGVGAQFSESVCVEGPGSGGEKCLWVHKECPSGMGTSCSKDSDCSPSEFCADADHTGSQRVCHPYLLEGDKCAGIAYTPKWQQLRCRPPLACSSHGDVSSGVCESVSVCGVGSCPPESTCVPFPSDAGFRCVSDVCEPDPCGPGLTCQPQPTSCAIALVCKQFVCVDEWGEEQAPVLAETQKTVYIGSSTLPCPSVSQPDKQCLQVRFDAWSPWSLYHHTSITGLKWEPNFEYKAVVNVALSAEGLPMYTLVKLMWKVFVGQETPEGVVVVDAVDEPNP